MTKSAQARFDGRKALKCNNVARAARRWCIKAGLETSEQLPLLIEFPASQHRTASQHVANRGGYALRLAAPRRLEAALKLKRKTVPAPSVSEPAGPPKLVRGKAVTWRLDLRSRVHRARFARFIEDLPVPKCVGHVHLHSAPPCGRSCHLVNINYSRGAQFMETADEFCARLRWTRQQHIAFKRRCKHACFSSSASHEQADNCRLDYVAKTAGKTRCSSARRTGKVARALTGWPWALTPSGGRRGAKSVATVHGCALGMPVLKKWRFESNHKPMVCIFRQLVCPGCDLHQRITSWNGHKGYGTRKAERYPSLLGRLMAEVITRRL